MTDNALKMSAWFAAMLTTILLSSPAAAKTNETLNQLAMSEGWLNLGHYRQNRFTPGYTSQADDPDFFLSGRGKTSPKAELKATLDAVEASGQDAIRTRCRFPARDRWLREQLNLPQKPISCPAYDQWRQELNTENVTLVFAASYLNSPSSMFGHTFLRLDPSGDNEKADLLLASTISYAADAAAHDSEIAFAYQGIFGGYPGITTIKPYYDKIRLYSDIENRDLWEYELNLTPDETSMLLAHAWEVKDINFDYYFFDENCAYRLLSLIDVARPGTNLLDEVNTHAIPSDTVRWVVDKGLVDDVHYRPSSATTVSYHLKQLPEAHQSLAAALANGQIKVDDPAIADMPPEQRAHLLDASYDYVRYESEEGDLSRKKAAPLSYKLLRARSRIDNADALADPPTPRLRDDQGHDTFRMSLLVGQQDHRPFTQVTIRPAYHDILDPPGGYRPGAQLQFLRFDARLYTDNQELQAEQLTAIEIRSLSERNKFFAPLSWQVGFGARRSDIESGKRIFTPYLEGGAGGSWALGDNGQAYGLATADAEIDDDLQRGFDLAPGVDAGMLFQSERFSASGGLRSKTWLAGDYHREDAAYANLGIHLNRQFSITGGWQRKHHFDRYETEWQIGLNMYF